ncbi:helix-turn-helix domain-containing protein [Mycobacterium sherrisii]|uniref:HTH luxR-type domain-containing protein n=1 Tax=Mycobacterium sherrisii TaxID=243061 RepID=A0A1E3SHG6_9MYCO|nr:helix-turn-helix transcriptional regulator [Mycobacterium sherrisii]MCV7029473.1 helix-turn-helix transcriptional regulator [Mycobacterium sherrisii]MEC4761613.1 helix-turn-helix transcriptional regulator [Mycobacterium sherrisii]ODR01590.1 hypothetical protein BHQ21_23260 [Mycobacterium sherrisii]ORW77661.1 hypothetical protein AWC25_08185 [Mycobacterium sherrisii]
MQPADGESPLTERLARDGYPNSQIGARLLISPRTVQWHSGRILAKLGVTSRWEQRAVDLAQFVLVAGPPG